jgi:glycosyltransferase involved in cell wall biosynthesis
VETGSGWFSDRTTRYLASGRPAVVQETGLPPDIAQGEGLLVFRTLEEAQAGARSVLEDYEKHASAARKIAEDLFDSDIVIGGLLEELVP